MLYYVYFKWLNIKDAKTTNNLIEFFSITVVLLKHTPPDSDNYPVGQSLHGYPALELL